MVGMLLGFTSEQKNSAQAQTKNSAQAQTSHMVSEPATSMGCSMQCGGSVGVLRGEKKRGEAGKKEKK